MSKLVGHKEENMVQERRKHKDDQEKHVISINHVKKTIEKKECRNK